MTWFTTRITPCLCLSFHTAICRKFVFSSFARTSVMYRKCIHSTACMHGCDSLHKITITNAHTVVHTPLSGSGKQNAQSMSRCLTSINSDRVGPFPRIRILFSSRLSFPKAYLYGSWLPTILPCGGMATT